MKTKLSCALSLSGFLLALPALAGEAAGPKVLVVGFSGAKKQALREKIVAALRDAGVEVVESKVDGKASPERLAKAASKADADVIVTGTGVLKKAGWKLVLAVHGGDDGALERELEVTAPWFPKLLERAVEVTSAELIPALGAIAPAATKASSADDEGESTKPADVTLEEEPEPEEEKAEDEGPEKADEPSSLRPSPLDLGAGLRAFSRSLTYNQDVNANLRPYEISGPSAFARLAWYPGAHFTSGLGGNIGITGAYEQSFATSSELEAGGENYGTVLRAFAVGLRLRLPFGSHEAGLGARYGQHAFTVHGDRDGSAAAAIGMPVTRDLVPDVSYSYARAGGDVRFVFGAVTLGASAGFRHVLSAGAIESDAWFPDATILSGDAEVFGGYRVADDVVALLGVGIERYGLDMNSKPAHLDEGRDVAGGAVDQYLSAWTGIEWRPGGRASGTEAAAAKPRLVAKR